MSRAFETHRRRIHLNTLATDRGTRPKCHAVHRSSLAKVECEEYAWCLNGGISLISQQGVGPRVGTYDMGGKDSTLDVAKAVADYASS